MACPEPSPDDEPGPHLGAAPAADKKEQSYEDDDDHRSPMAIASEDSESSSAVIEDSKGNNSGLSSFKLLLLALVVVQNCSLVLVARYTRASASPDDAYSVNHLLVVIETFKLLLSAGLEYHNTEGKLIESLQLHVMQRPLDAAKILVPALLYLVQNGLLFLALSNLTAPVFQVTYQGKLVTTALVSVAMLQRSYSVQQWICLVILSLGVAVVVLEKEESGSDKEEKVSDEHAGQNLFVGLVAVGIACFSSALAGVYFEKVLKKPPNDVVTPPSLWMRNMQLAFFSVVIAVAQGFWSVQEGETAAADKPYFHGFTAWVWTVVLLQAAGGLLIAAVIKYADNVLKGLATGVSVVVSTILSTLLFRTPLSPQFVLGATLILVSVYVFSNPVSMATVAVMFRNPLLGAPSGSTSSSRNQGTELKALLPV